MVLRGDGTVILPGAWDTPLPLDPGEHVIEASKPGKKLWKSTITIEPRPGVTPLLVPVLEDAPPEARPVSAPFWSGRRIAGLSVSSGGVIGVAVGSVFGARALSQNNSSKAQCQPQNPAMCSASGAALYHDAVTSAHVSTTGLVVGGAAVVAGLVVLLTAPDASAKAGAAHLEALPVVDGGTRGIVVRAAW